MKLAHERPLSAENKRRAIEFEDARDEAANPPQRLPRAGLPPPHFRGLRPGGVAISDITHHTELKLRIPIKNLWGGSPTCEAECSTGNSFLWTSSRSPEAATRTKTQYTQSGAPFEHSDREIAKKLA